MKRVTGFLGTLMPAGLAGGFFFLVMGRVSEPGEGHRTLLFLIGWLYGVVVLGLLRLFRVAPWGYPVVGLFAGPVPLGLFVTADMAPDDRGGAWLLSAVLGLLIGVIEWARTRA